MGYTYNPDNPYYPKNIYVAGKPDNTDTLGNPPNPTIHVISESLDYTDNPIRTRRGRRPLSGILVIRLWSIFEGQLRHARISRLSLHQQLNERRVKRDICGYHRLIRSLPDQQNREEVRDVADRFE